MHQLLKQLTQLSRAAKFASLCCALLLLLTLLAWGIFQLDPARVAWADYMTISRGLMLGLLLAMTTGAIYFSARLWLDEAPANIDEVESAWQSGLTALANVGLSIRDLPVLLFVGAATTKQQRQFINACSLKLLVDAPATVNAPLNWFATDEAIYLFCGSAGVLGRTVEHLRKSAGYFKADHQQGFESWLPTQSDAVLSESIEESANLASTGRSDVSLSQAAPIFPTRHSLVQAEPGGTATLTRTRGVAKSSSEQQTEQQLNALDMLVQEELEYDQRGVSRPYLLQAANLSLLTSTEVAVGQQALFDFCTRLRGQRRPVAAINGIALLVDINVATSSDSAARQCGDAVRVDLKQVRDLLGQHAPISIILTGAEYQPGVTEAIRRLGPARASNLTLGRACDPREVTSNQLVETSVEQLFISIDKLVHHLIRSPDSLAIPGNNCLIRLIIECRQRFCRPLSILLSQALLVDHDTAVPQCAFFNGLFLAAIGERQVDRGFTGPLLNRLQAQQHWLAWSATELRRQRRERFIVNTFVVICAIEGMVLVAQVLL